LTQINEEDSDISKHVG